MSNIFNSVFNTKVKKSRITMNYDHKLTLDMGNLVPIHVQEVVPGDIIKQKTEIMLRFAPLLAPIMHRVDVFCHFFYVPNRLLWPNWESFITGDGEVNAIEHAVPTIPLKPGGTGIITTGTLLDYLGVPNIPAGDDLDISALPFAAYAKIYDEYYRDQNLIDPIFVPLIDGSNGSDTNPGIDQMLTLQKRAWQHDYFTGALPFAQKGDSVNLPIGGAAEVYRNDGANPNDRVDWGANDSQGGVTVSAVNRQLDPEKDDAILFADLSEATSTSIRDLRRAFKLQEWLEKNARGGTRYIESILSHFGVKSSDARLNRPEYLGGARTPATISEVLQTSETSETAQANMAGHGISVGAGRGFSYRCEEHGFIMGIMSVMPKTAYQQGLSRMFTRNDRLDYYWPSFQHIGEQEVKNKEVYVAGQNVTREGTFGYIPRYAEYKFIPSKISGDFKGNLDYWHLGRKFDNQPHLTKEFVECDASKRIFAVTDPSVNSLYAHCFHSIDAIRPMAKYANPKF